jgi:hypothetical protein
MLENGVYGNNGYGYSLYLQIENPNKEPFSFDRIVMRFDSSTAVKCGQRVREVTICSTPSKIREYFLYYGVVDSPRLDTLEDSLKLLSVQGGHAVSFGDPFDTGPVCPTYPKSKPTEMSIVLLQDGVEVTERQVCVLPPVLRIPDEYGLKDSERGFHIELRPEWTIPSASGITGKALITSLFAKAKSISPDAVLTEVRPRFVMQHELDDGSKRYTCSVWLYIFWSPKGVFSLYKDDPGSFEWQTRGLSEKPSVVIEPGFFKEAKIDCDIAVLILDIAGARIDSLLSLEPIQMEQGTCLAWVQSYEEGHQQIGILVTSGEVVLRNQESNTFEFAEHCIWND